MVRTSITKMKTPLVGSLAKACTEVITPDLTINVPIKEKENANIAKSTVQLFKVLRFSTTIDECKRAAAINQGINDAYGGGQGIAMCIERY